MKSCRITNSIVAASLVWILAGSPAWGEEAPPPGELETLKRMMQEIISENRELKARIRKLEEAITQQGRAAEQPAKQAGKEPTKEAAKEAAKDLKHLEERVKELETEKTVREDATRTIIRQALSTLGSKINESVALGGTLEVLAGSREDFAGKTENLLNLNTAELDFEIQANEWTLGSLVVQYVDGTDVLFPTTAGFNTGVERLNIDTAFITIGDLQRFPPFATAGRFILPFGSSTGDPVLNVLTIEDPLTIEVFEMREVALGFGLGFPTPDPTPPVRPVTPPPVRPLLINPLVSSLMRGLGYSPSPTRPRPPTPVTPRPDPPPFNAGVYSYNGDTFQGLEKRGWTPEDNIGATVGFRTKGHCGRPYDQLGADGRWLEIFCPWSIDVDIDYNTSVFDSRFLEFEYRPFLGQIGFVPGVAAHVKSALGPVALIGEWNGAISRAKFVDDSGTFVTMEPSAWQVSLAYQFDWNPWVEAIGAQGTYFTIGYSESHDLAGVRQAGERVGFVPRRRFLVGLGEWVLDGVRLAIEYSYNEDYERGEGGTGRSADAFFSTLTYVW